MDLTSMTQKALPKHLQIESPIHMSWKSTEEKSSSALKDFASAP